VQSITTVVHGDFVLKSPQGLKCRHSDQCNAPGRRTRLISRSAALSSVTCSRTSVARTAHQNCRTEMACHKYLLGARWRNRASRTAVVEIWPAREPPMPLALVLRLTKTFPRSRYGTVERKPSGAERCSLAKRCLGYTT
jgi:hypothetical protein